MCDPVLAFKQIGTEAWPPGPGKREDVFGLVCPVTTGVPPHAAATAGVVLLIKFLNAGLNGLLCVLVLQRLRGTLHHVLMQLLGHRGILQHSFSVARG